MSGGYFDDKRLEFCEPHELIEYREQLQVAADELLKLGFEREANEMQQVLRLMSIFLFEMKHYENLLSGVLHDLDYYLSSDIGLDTLTEKIESYRNGYKNEL